MTISRHNPRFVYEQAHIYIGRFNSTNGGSTALSSLFTLQHKRTAGEDICSSVIGACLSIKFLKTMENKTRCVERLVMDSVRRARSDYSNRVYFAEAAMLLNASHLSLTRGWFLNPAQADRCHRPRLQLQVQPNLIVEGVVPSADCGTAAKDAEELRLTRNIGGMRKSMRIELQALWFAAIHGVFCMGDTSGMSD
ncbi:hypothetical protein NX059_001090 [Plenodomus lindquistii]|nr:hypothetical protein NX059_001090 [Plenodomus lindquistii]